MQSRCLLHGGGPCPAHTAPRLCTCALAAPTRPRSRHHRGWGQLWASALLRPAHGSTHCLRAAAPQDWQGAVRGLGSAAKQRWFRLLRFVSDCRLTGWPGLPALGARETAQATSMQASSADFPADPVGALQPRGCQPGHDGWQRLHRASGGHPQPDGRRATAWG